MHISARGRVRDPPGFTRTTRDLAVQRHGGLAREQRAMGDPVIENQIQVRALALAHAGDHLDARRAQQFEAAPGVGRVRIGRAHDHVFDAGGNDRLGTGAGAAWRRARFERDVEDRAGPGRFSAREQRQSLGMRSAVGRRRAFAYDLTIFDDERTHHRIRVRRAPDAARKLERPPHEFFVVNR